ncbi:MAG: hypothetical protein MNPFHGCM_01871 [Gemmatimonadaceae bacterium]|nr:hypothetical protein [Gemmatimonadaceae bacterium]
MNRRIRVFALALIAAGTAVGGAGAQEAPADLRSSHVIRGFVYDSVARQPLGGAIVQLMLLGVDPERTVRLSGVADVDGRYEIAGVPDGAMMVGFFHPKLDSLGMEAPVRRVRIPGDGANGLDLSVPSPRSIVEAACGRSALEDSSGFVAGYVLRPEDGSTREHAEILARWSEIIIDESGARAATRQATTVTGPGGWFGLCGIPHRSLALLRVSAGADTGSFVEIELPDHGILLRGMYLSSQSVARATDADVGSENPVVLGDSDGRRIVRAGATGLLPTREGRVRLTGTIRGRYGDPIAGARVSIWGTRYSAITNADGEYAIGDVAPGSHTLEVRAIGFVPSRTAIDLFAQRPMHADVSMSDFPTEIDTVRVLATRPRMATSPGSFEYRRRQGYGAFLDAEQIERRSPQQFSDLLRGTRGVLISSSGMSGAYVRMEGNGPDAACEPLIVLDGQRVPLNGMNINDLIPTHIVRAVEIYPRRMEAPPEFQTVDCGTIVVWTGARGWLAKRTAARLRKP